MLDSSMSTIHPARNSSAGACRPANPSPGGAASGLAADVANLYAVALRDRWGVALAVVGWVHLAIFLACQWLYSGGDRLESHYLPLWGLDLGVGLLILRGFLMSSDSESPPPLTLVVARVWVTFLILAFSSAILNAVVGFETDWFKASWATLSTFGFAMMAWICHLKFLVPALQMSLTAMLIARYPASAYALYGGSWCLALNVVGYALEKRRIALIEAGVETI